MNSTSDVALREIADLRAQLDQIEARLCRSREDASRPILTPRQMAIMEQMAAGQTAKQAARNLGIAVGTVKAHIALATARLGAANTAQAVAMVSRVA